MYRNFEEKLKIWSSSHNKSPLLVIGARQVGKTYTIQRFCENNYANLIEINFMEQKEFIDIFHNATSFSNLIETLELRFETKLDSPETVIFFDEIQKSPEALEYLKFFKESERDYNVISAGSLLGVALQRHHISFPVGAVEREYLYPLSFDEFLRALGHDNWVEAIKAHFNDFSPIPIHDELMKIYHQYLCTGGMPASVREFIDQNQDIVLYKAKNSGSIIQDYIADMAQYTESPTETKKIQLLYHRIPNMLGDEKTATKRFNFSNISEDSRKRDYDSPLSWLVLSRLVLISSQVKIPQIPLSVNQVEGAFKVYLNDVGLLTKTTNLPLNQVMLDSDYTFKGSLTENYIAQSFQTNNLPIYYYRNEQTGTEIDFLLQNNDGIIPIEVKSSENLRSKSLASYVNKYNPPYAYLISANNFKSSDNIRFVPLYAAWLIK